MLLQLSNLPASSDPVMVFYSYSHKDEELRGSLDEHLTILKREGFISSWHDKAIGPGEEWKNKIDENLDTADIILLLISSSFIASDYCYDVEMKRALERHTAGQAKVIPILLRPVVWQIAPFAKLQALPQNGKPVIKWEVMDDAFVDIAENIRKIAADVTIKIPIPSSLSLDDLTGQWVLTLENNKNDIIRNCKF